MKVVRLSQKSDSDKEPEGVKKVGKDTTEEISKLKKDLDTYLEKCGGSMDEASMLFQGLAASKKNLINLVRSLEYGASHVGPEGQVALRNMGSMASSMLLEIKQLETSMLATVQSVSRIASRVVTLERTQKNRKKQ